MLVRLKAENIKAIIKRKGLKRYWVAMEVGIHLTTFRRWLSGDIAHVTKVNASRLADALCEPEGEVFERVPPPDWISQRCQLCHKAKPLELSAFLKLIEKQPQPVIDMRIPVCCAKCVGVISRDVMDLESRGLLEGIKP